MSRFKIGENVLWRGNFGTDKPKQAKITSIELCQVGEKYGKKVTSVSLTVVAKGGVIFDLDNGRWARGHQISKIK